jgi:hypothetical protein
MTQEDLGYTKGKIFQALSVLALDEGELRQRVPRAYAELSPVSHFTGYEQEFATVRRILRKVTNGDWSRVSDSDMKEIAVAIWNMSTKYC